MNVCSINSAKSQMVRSCSASSAHVDGTDSSTSSSHVKKHSFCSMNSLRRVLSWLSPGWLYRWRIVFQNSTKASRQVAGSLCWGNVEAMRHTSGLLCHTADTGPCSKLQTMDHISVRGVACLRKPMTVHTRHCPCRSAACWMHLSWSVLGHRPLLLRLSLPPHPSRSHSSRNKSLLHSLEHSQRGCSAHCKAQCQSCTHLAWHLRLL